MYKTYPSIPHAVQDLRENPVSGANGYKHERGFARSALFKIAFLDWHYFERGEFSRALKQIAETAEKELQWARDSYPDMDFRVAIGGEGTVAGPSGEVNLWVSVKGERHALMGPNAWVGASGALHDDE